MKAVGAIIFLGCIQFNVAAAACPNFSGKWGQWNENAPHWIYNQDNCNVIHATYCINKSDCSVEYDLILDGLPRDAGDFSGPVSYTVSSSELVVKYTNRTSISAGGMHGNCEASQESWKIDSQGRLQMNYTNATCADGFSGALPIETKNRL